MALFLTPLLDSRAPGPPPDPAARTAALRQFRARLADVAGENQAAARALAPAAERLARSLDRIAADPARLASFEAAVFLFLPGRLDRLKDALGAEPVTLAGLPESIRERYITPDGRARIQVFPADDLSDTAAMARFTAAVRSVVPNATDSPVEIIEAANTVISAVRQAAITAAVLVALALLVLLRSVRDTALVLLPLVLAAALTCAVSVLADLPFNFANVIVLPLLAGLGVASGIHLVMRAGHEGAGAALVETSTPRAVICSALTTIFSFGSLAISTHRGTASMGELLMIAIGFTLLCTLVVLPALLAWFPASGKARSPHG
jgi:predicted RND superfamily exporter protein